MYVYGVLKENQDMDNGGRGHADKEPVEKQVVERGARPV